MDCCSSLVIPTTYGSIKKCSNIKENDMNCGIVFFFQHSLHTRGCKKSLLLRIFRAVVKPVEALGQKKFFDTKKNDYCSRSVEGISRLALFFADYFSQQEELHYLSPIDRSLCIFLTSLKFLGEGGVEAQM